MEFKEVVKVIYVDIDDIMKEAIKIIEDSRNTNWSSRSSRPCSFPLKIALTGLDGWVPSVKFKLLKK